MRSIKSRFEYIRKKYPNIGDYVAFARAVRGQKFSRKMVVRWFNILVDKSDYENKGKFDLIRHLTSLSKSIEEGNVEGKLPRLRDM